MSSAKIIEVPTAARIPSQHSLPAARRRVITIHAVSQLADTSTPARARRSSV